MKERRKVRGLLGIIEAEANGEEWEPEAPSADYVPGMGMGATKQATRWAWLGMQREISESIGNFLESPAEQPKRPANRPRKDPLKKADAMRAFRAWSMCREVRRKLGDQDKKFTNGELIGMVKATEESMGVKGRDQLFSASDKTNEQSLSRGRTLLRIDENWNSEVCEKLAESFAQTT